MKRLTVLVAIALLAAVGCKVEVEGDKPEEKDPKKTEASSDTEVAKDTVEVEEGTE